MATIGSFTQQSDGGYAGSIKTLTLNVKSAQLRPNEKSDEKAPVDPRHAWIIYFDI